MTAPVMHPSRPCFDLATTTTAGGCVVTVRGDVDATTAPDLRSCLLGALHRPDVTDLEVDLSSVTFLDSAGLTVLVAAHQAAQRAGRVLRVRCGTGRAVARPLAITGLSTVLTLVDA
jgi:anti-sigma B factor antagonist